MTARVVGRDFAAFLTVNGGLFAEDCEAEDYSAGLNLRYGTDNALHVPPGGSTAVTYRGLLAAIPQPSQALKSDYGITAVDSLSIDIADTTIQTRAFGLVGEIGYVDHVLTTYYADGTSSTGTTTLGYAVTSISTKPGLVTVNLVDIQAVMLDTLYPTRTWTADDWPGIFADDAGKVVAWATGTALKIPAVLLSTGGGSGPWVYGVCEWGATVLTVYRDGRIVSPSEYTTGPLGAASTGYTALTLAFGKEQVDYTGNPYSITVDCQGSGNNAVTELARLLAVAGATIDTASFSAAHAYAASNKMLCDIGYTAQRAISGIVTDLLEICRASLVRTAAGAYQIVQDQPSVPTATYDESAGSLIEVKQYDGPEAPKTVELKYGPSSSGQLTYTVTRSAGGYAGTKNFQAAYVSDHEAADRLSCYLAQRAKFGGKAKATIYVDSIALGEQISIASPALWEGYRSFTVAGATRIAGGTDCVLWDYDGAIHTYTAQAFPAGATQGYSPDYSKTPPDAPTNLLLGANACALNADGTGVPYVMVEAIPPATNWTKIYFQATNSTTGEIYQAQGKILGAGPYYAATISGLRPNQAHTVVAWCENGFGVQGIVCTAVAFGAATYGTPPAAPTSPVVTQGTGRVLTLTWTATAGTNISGYQVFRSTGGGGWVQVATVTGTSFADTFASYGVSLSYKVRAFDTFGNTSVDSTTAALTTSVNVGTSDITDSAVTTPKRQDMNLYAISYPGLGPNTWSNSTCTHNFGRTAIVVPSLSISTVVIASVRANNTTSFQLGVNNDNSTENETRAFTAYAHYW